MTFTLSQFLGIKRNMLGIAALALIISPFISILAVQNSYATNEYQSMTTIDRLKTRDAFTILGKCLKSGEFTIKAGGINDFSKWIVNSSAYYSIPAYDDIDNDGTYNPKGNFVNCTEWFSTYSEILKIDDPEKFAEDAGIQFAENAYGGKFAGTCKLAGYENTTNNNAETCLRYALYSRLDLMPKDGKTIEDLTAYDGAMLYIRNKVILDRACSTNWSSKTENSATFSIQDWYSTRNTQKLEWPNGLWREPLEYSTTSASKVNLVNNSNNPTAVTPFIVMNRLGDGGDGWAKIVKVEPSEDNNQITKSCGDLVKQLDTSYSTGFVQWTNNWKRTHGNENPPASGLSKDDTETEDGNDSESTSCAIPGLGWILCPVITVMANIADETYAFLADNFLKVDTNLMVTKDDPATPDVVEGGTYTAWSYMRNIANVFFVIVFLIIIFSQLTGQGIANYGIKKMLPRLVVAAILVNLSFVVCQLAVDLSNIIGVSIKNVFNIAGANIINAADAGTGEKGTWIGVVTIVLAGAAIGWAVGLSVLLPFLIGALIAFVMVFLILIIRQVIIVLLIVVAPLAFVAYLLPNTNNLFTKWRKMFVALLIVFPMIGLLFGAASLASGILGAAYNGSDDTIQKIIAAGVVALPLFLLPSLLKGSLNSVGTLGAKINGFGAKTQGAAKRGTSKAYEGSRLGQFGKYRKEKAATRKALIQSGAYEGRGGGWNLRNRRSNLNKRINESGLSGEFGNRSLATGLAVADKEDKMLVETAGSRLDNARTPDGAPLTQAQKIQIAKGLDVTASGKNGPGEKVIMKAATFDEHTRRAAMQRAASIATVAEAHELIQASSARDSKGQLRMSTAERKTLSSTLASSGIASKAPHLGGPTLGAIEQGTANVENAARDAMQKGKITAESLAAADATAIETYIEIARKSGPTSAEHAVLKEAYAKITAPGSRLGEKVASDTTAGKSIQKISTL